MNDRILSHYLREILVIRTLGQTGKKRWRLFSEYTRLYVRYVLAVKFGILKSSPVRIGPFAVTPSDFGSFRFLFEEVYIRRIYDVTLPSDHPTIFDCGANIGMSLAFFKEKYPGAKLVAFEPDPENSRCLHSTIQANFPDATAHNVALGAEPGHLPLYFRTGSGGSISKSLFKELVDAPEISSESVEVVRLSEYLTSPVDLLKIDVEGAETAIIRDIIATDTIRFVKAMIIEFHEINRKDSRSFSEFLSTLQRHGFFFTLAAELHQDAQRIDLAFDQTILVYAVRLSAERIDQS